MPAQPPTTLLLDIETAPQRYWEGPASPLFQWSAARELEALAKETHPRNMTSPASIEAWKEGRTRSAAARAEKRWHACSTSTTQAQIVSIVVQNVATGGVAAFGDPEDEHAVLEAFNGALDRFPGRLRFVAWRGSDFDFPMLAARLSAHGFYSEAACFHEIHYGTRMELGISRRGPVELIDAHKIYPLARFEKTRLRDLDLLEWADLDPLNGDGGAVLEALQSGRFDDVLKHNRVDVEQRLATVWEQLAPLLAAHGVAL